MIDSDLAVFRASTSGPQAVGFDAFREHIGRTILRIDMSPLGDAPIACDVAVRKVGDVAIATGHISPMTSYHPETLGDDALVLAAVRGGVAEFDYGGGPARLTAGEAMLTANADSGTFTGQTATRLTNIRLERGRLGLLGADPDLGVRQMIPADHYALRLLLGYADVLADSENIADGEARRVVVGNLYDLAVLAIGHVRDGQAHAGGVRAARLYAVKAEMRRRFREPLAIGEIARRHGISASYLRQLFAAEGQSFADYLLGLRLEAVRRTLLDTRHGSLSVGGIAYDAGFGDLSYFNRAFRRRYGMTPSELRHRR